MDAIEPQPKRRTRKAAPAPVTPEAIVASVMAEPDVQAIPPVLAAPVHTDTPQEPSVAPAAATPNANADEDTTMNETIQTMTDKVQADAKAAFTQAGDQARSAMEKGKQAFADMGDFTRGNIEAMVESTRIAFKGFEAMAQTRAAFAKQSFDATAATMKSLAAVTSPTEFFKVQGEHVRASVDAIVAEASRETEAALKLAGEIAQPIQNRIALAADKLKIAA